MQAMNVLNLLRYNIVKPHGTVCIECAPTDGIGVHHLFQPVNGMYPAKFDTAFKDLIGQRRLGMICPTISKYAIQECFENPIPCYNSISHFLLAHTQGENFGDRAINNSILNHPMMSIVRYNAADVMMKEKT